MNSVLPGLGVHHIALRASDFARSLAFYEALGLRPIARWQNAAGTDIALLDIGNGSAIELFGGGEKEMPEGRFFHLALYAEDVDAAFAAAVGAGAVTQREPCDVELPSNPPLPVRLCFVQGPDGETLEFFHPKN